MAKASRADASARRPTAVTRTTAPARPRSGGLVAALDAVTSDRGLWLAGAAWLLWLLGHVPALGWWAMPAWAVAGVAVGLFRPWYGLLLTILVVPFTGGATDVQTGEVFRVLPVYGSAVRVLLDRFVILPSFGRATPHEPPWWVVAAAIAAAALYFLTALTAYIDTGHDWAFFTSGLQWLAGGSVAMMAAWAASSHLVAGRDRTLTMVVLVTTVAACLLAIGAWIGLPGVDLLTFPSHVEGDRLGALGYPTPTAMGLATVLPLAVAAAWRIRRWLVVPVIALVLLTMVLTHSRGPLVAVAVGAVLAVLAARRVDRRLAVAGAAIGGVALVALVAVRYGTDLTAIVATINASMGSDADRLDTWVAAVTITAANPVLGGGWYALLRVGSFADLRIANSHNVLLDAFASGGLPLGITNAIVILYSGAMAWVRRHTMAPYLIAAVVAFLICGLWDIPQVRSYAAVMGGIVLGMAAGPLIARSADPEEPVT
jgi:hypothetical protein